MKAHTLTLVHICCSILFLACGASVQDLHAQEASTPGNSRITEVVIYPNYAQITREMTTDLKKGENTVRFTGLVSILEAESLKQPDRITFDGKCLELAIPLSVLGISGDSPIEVDFSEM